jgi:hypothetical protein
MYDFEDRGEERCAHSAGLSARGPIAPWLAWPSSGVFAWRLTSGALGTPDASVRTVGGNVTARFTACRVAIGEERRKGRCAGRSQTATKDV